MARLLLKAGADKDLQDCEGRTALVLAAENDHLEIALLLLEARADEDLQACRGHQPRLKCRGLND